MSRFGRLVLLLGIGLLAAVGITGVLAGSGGLLTGSGGSSGGPSGGEAALSDASGTGIEVLGDVIDCLPVGAGPEDVQSKFQTEGNEFQVIGTLSSFDGVTVVVAGPSGDVSADLGLDFELTGDLTPGAAAKMEGSVAADGSMTAREVASACAGAGVIDCPAGVDPSLQLKVEGDTFEFTGLLKSLTSTMVQVDGPGVLVEAAVDAGTEVNIDPASPAGTPVKVQGSIGADGGFLARQIGDACGVAPEEPPAPPALAAAEEECNRGPGQHGELRLEIDDGEVEIERGTVLSPFADSVLTVDTPGGPLTVMIDAGTEVDGDLSLATEVRVEGTLTDSDTVLADEVKALCPDAAHHADDDGDVDDVDEGDVDDGDVDEGDVDDGHHDAGGDVDDGHHDAGGHADED